MRLLVLSDVHGNVEALDAVLARVRRKRFDAVLMLGDVVGYGAAPNQVVERLLDLAPPMHGVRGNHDKVATGIDRGAEFNEVALAAARWTERRLTPSNLRWVRDLPRGPREVAPDLAICHGSPLDEDVYVFSDYDAEQIFAAHRPRVTFFGHTHVTSAFVETPARVVVRPLRGEGRLVLDPGFRYLLNPGSIGQPRDRDPRASFMTFDTRRQVVRWYRVPYPVEKAQERIRRAGLPGVLADRLAAGA
ncbi:MAG TPA: metallophosphoesterase family protein [Thermoanaerobaculia bacterium]|nr:metallophosphoesterase family protein [Thermoanaerobaculia bacterium]